MKPTLVIWLLFYPLANAADITVQKNVPYLSAERTEKLDVYLPPESFPRPLPAILLIHGGGWMRGDKASRRYQAIATTLAENGYAVFSINYLLNQGRRDANNRLRLSRVAWPQSLYDCKSALRFIRHHASRFGISPNRIGVMGGSAGGHLAMMVAATAGHEKFNRGGLYLDQSNEVACVVTLYGIHDLRASKITPFTGAPQKPAPSVIDNASPFTHFHPDLAPFFIAHGTADTVVPLEHSQKLTAILDSLGVENTYVEVEGGSHSFGLQPPEKDLRGPVLQFLERHLNPTPSKTP